MPDALRTFGAL